MSLFLKSSLLLALAGIALTLIPGTNSCADDRITAERPRDEIFRTALKNEPSSLNITIEATSDELSDQLNRLTPKVLYKGSTSARGLGALIVRNGPIVASTHDDYVYITIPVTCTLSYGILESPAVANRIKFRLSPRITPDWKITAEVLFMGLGELLPDTVRIGTHTIRPRIIVEGIIQPMQRSLSELFSRKLNEKIQLKAQVARAWNTVQKPILLDKSCNAWLRIAPREVLLYPFSARSNRVKLSLALTSIAELVVGPQPPAAKQVSLPDLKPANGPDRAFRVVLNSDLYYRDILSIVAPRLLNTQVGGEGRDVILKDLDLYGNGDRLMIKVETAGDLDGIFYLTCRPAFNPRTGVFSVEDVDFDLQSSDLLLQTADWFLHGTIRERLQERLNIDLAQRLAQAREAAGKALARVNLADNVVLAGSVTALRLHDVLVLKDRMSIQVHAEGEAAILFH